MKLLHRETFPKTSRLTKRSEFLDLFRKGRKIHTANFVMFSRARCAGGSRLGLTVSTKVGNSVVRNRVKRLLREFFRRQHRMLLLQRDLVIVAKKGAGELSTSQLHHEIQTVLTSRGSARKDA